jgi:hypothetical protein
LVGITERIIFNTPGIIRMDLGSNDTYSWEFIPVDELDKIEERDSGTESCHQEVAYTYSIRGRGHNLVTQDGG